MRYEVCEKFVSINGEGRRSGQLAVFVRFKGCNLSCSYCDTSWANAPDAAAEIMTVEEICGYVRSTDITNVTLTGGEPLKRGGMYELLKMLKAQGNSVEVETNGAVKLDGYCMPDVRPDCFTMDYKLPSSGMESKMVLSNFKLLSRNDCLKLVAGSESDLERALEIINEFRPICHIYLSPVFGKISPRKMVEFMAENRLNGVNLQIQMHKVIWNPDERGV